MLQKLKVLLLRKYYRYASARAWRDQTLDLAPSVLQAETSAGPLTLRMYVADQSSQASEALPLIVYFHGGGWVIGDLDTHQPFCQYLCKNSGCTVISVDYRLAPEQAYPAAHDDSLAATRWIAEHIDDLGPSNGRLVLAGDSAGANLATTACLQLASDVRERVVGEIVIYPITDHNETSHPSYVEKARGHTLTTNIMRWFWQIYLGPNGTKPERAMPLHEDNLASLPPTLLVTAENDPLRDEGIAYAQALAAAGVTVQHRHFDQAAHGFACSEGLTADFSSLMDDMSQWLGSDVLADASD